MAGMINLSHTPGVRNCICNFALSLFTNQLIVLYQPVSFVQNSLSIVTQRINDGLPLPFGKYNLLSEFFLDWTKDKGLRKNLVGSKIPGLFVKTRQPRHGILCSKRDGHSPQSKNLWNGKGMDGMGNKTGSSISSVQTNKHGVLIVGEHIDPGFNPHFI